MKRPLLTTLLVILGGFVLSIVVSLATNPICDQLQKHRVAGTGRERADTVANDLQSTLAIIQDFAQTFPTDEELTAERFRQLTQSLVDHPRIFTVEWSPVVPAESRADAETQVAARSGRNIQFTTYRDGHTRLIPNGETCQPITFAEPQNQKTRERLGFQRGDWAAFQFSVREPGQPFATAPFIWYSLDPVRVGVFATPPYAEGASHKGTVFVTLEDAFPASLSDNQYMTVRVEDVTNPKYSVLENVGDQLLFETASSANRYVARQQIGGRLYEFVAAAKSPDYLRPTWLPWVCFFLTNLIACISAFLIHQRESKRLERDNDQLQKEIERRTAVERHLQGTLDFREQERELVAHDIHDGFVQDVIGAQMYIQAALADPVVNDQPVQNKLETVSNLLGQAIHEARRTIDYLKPKVVDEVGLVAALEAAHEADQRNYGFDVRLHFDPNIPRLPLLAERIMYRIAREALCNVRQHSGVMQANLSLTLVGDKLCLEVTDTGMGFDAERIDADRFGLAGMRQRANVLSGKLTISTSEFGTKIQVEIPTDQPEVQTLAIPGDESLSVES